MGQQRQKSNIEAYLETKRKLLPARPTPHDALARSTEQGVYLIDIRPTRNRKEEGLIPGAIVIDRNVLEWRLDHTSPWSILEAREPSFTPILFCNEGYASSLAAQTLVEIGVERATDVDGGFRKWKDDGLPVLKEDSL
ncbi:hypothetical protein L198_05956 [Cryptococcus wingfieldii CBS 7118]|uniref:Rhodanese domain-containing protein n=1 Tax=Cryptococcus wingfieldii CBS 7118 TaxID=1295528 RepID=A0A1E3IS55_9TREE|nr:hypothetical protein L198_05956 [Cryptococcus wingfieldii CBS 7118]ODN91440.1 hypothetical protein L198_05956 [Cryptococcus wingfieldii CBS 7118]